MRAWAGILLSIFTTASAWAQDGARAIKTESAELVAVGQIQAQFGVEFLHAACYSLSGLEGDLLRLGIMSVRVGAGDYAEFLLSGVGRDYLTINKRYPAVLPTTISGNTTSDFGDLIIGAKLKLTPEKGPRPAISFKFATQLPNASNEKGLGNDETEFFSTVLLSKHLGKALVSGNLGLAILGSPVQANSQADLLTYGFSFVLPVHQRLELIGELSGRQGPDHLGNENLSQAQMGARIRAGGMRWDVAGIVGFKDQNPRSGLAVSVTFDFQAFHKKRIPVTIPSEKAPAKK